MDEKIKVLIDGVECDYEEEKWDVENVFTRKDVVEKEKNLILKDKLETFDLEVDEWLGQKVFVYFRDSTNIV